MKKKVLFVINTMGLGGAERAMLDLLRAIPADAAELDLLVLIGRGELFGEVPDTVHIRNKTFEAASVLDAQGQRMLRGIALGALWHHGAFVTRGAYLCKNLFHQLRAGRVQPDKLLWRLISDATPATDMQYDLAVAFLEGGAAYYVAEHVRATRKVAFIHIDYPDAGYTRALDRGCFDAMDEIYVVSEGVGERFLTVYPEYRGKVRLFRNLIDIKRIQRLAESGTGFSDAFDGARLLTVGRLHPQKGYDVAIQAMRLLRERPVKWYVLGEGALRATLEAQIRQNDLQDRFILLGARANPYPFMRQADIYVHATRFEGRSIAIEEAQALGKPIIATDCTGNREQITSGVNGLLVECAPEAIAQAVARLLDDPALCARLGDASRPDIAAAQAAIRTLLQTDREMNA